MKSHYPGVANTRQVKQASSRRTNFYWLRPQDIGTSLSGVFNLWRRIVCVLLLVLTPLLSACGSPQNYELTAKDQEKLAKAIKEDTPAVFQEYAQKGMNPNAQDTSGTPYITLAIRQGYSDIVRQLLNERADPNLKDAKGNTLLHIAVEEQRPDIVNVLLKWGADVNAKNNESDTPLLIAVRKQNPDIVRSLVEKKADVSLKNKEGKTAREVATEHKNDAALTLLQR